eukprot:809330-Pyramimonas_sp.AAC.1
MGDFGRQKAFILCLNGPIFHESEPLFKTTRKPLCAEQKRVHKSARSACADTVQSETQRFLVLTGHLSGHPAGF